jgi:DNA processing protein
VPTRVNRLDLLTLLQLPGVGRHGALRLASADLDSVREGEGWEAARREAEAILSDCEQLEIGVVGWFDDPFPERLREIPDAPPILFYRGAIEAADADKAVAIVGTRKPTGWGREATAHVADAFARRGWVIVSGLALGVDTIAHECALGGRAPTIAVLGNGLASVYPAANRGLAADIVRGGGLLLAEVAPRSTVTPRALVGRDRLQSGLATLTVVCQGGTGSGAMHTARYAAAQGRPLYALGLDRKGEAPGSEDEGILALLQEPARNLPDRLPAWKRVSKAALGDAPAALVLDEASLSDVSLGTGAPREETLF